MSKVEGRSHSSGVLPAPAPTPLALPVCTGAPLCDLLIPALPPCASAGTAPCPWCAAALHSWPTAHRCWPLSHSALTLQRRTASMARLLPLAGSAGRRARAAPQNGRLPRRRFLRWPPGTKTPFWNSAGTSSAGCWMRTAMGKSVELRKLLSDGNHQRRYRGVPFRREGSHCLHPPLFDLYFVPPQNCAR